MSISFWLDQSKNASHQADIVIIGGGLSGLSTAYWILNEDPNLKVIVVEKDRVAFGASGRNAGFITCGSVEHFNRLVEKHGELEAIQIWQFSEKNLELLKDHIIQSDEKNLHFDQQGTFSLASTETELRELKKSSTIMEKNGIKIEVLNEAQIQKRIGAVNFVGGIKYLKDASINPYFLINKIVTKLKSNPNFQILEFHEVFKVENIGDNKKVFTDRGSIESQIVIYATNGFSPLLHNYFKDKVFATKGQILVTEKVPFFMEGPCYANFVLDYFRQLPTGELLIGGFRQMEKETEVGYSQHITDKIQHALYEFTQTYLPHFKDKKVTHRWAGIMGFSVDGQPQVGSLPEDPQSYFSIAFTGHGLGLCFHTAKVLVDLIFGREIPNFISAKRL